MNRLIIFTLSLGICSGGLAQEPAASDARESSLAESVSDAQSGNEPLIKNRSSFSQGTITRNPYWPIGWEPQPDDSDPTTIISENTEKIVEVQPEQLKVSTILIGNPSIAIVNGKEVGIGSELKVVVDNTEVTLKVVHIGDGYVECTYRGKIVRSMQLR